MLHLIPCLVCWGLVWGEAAGEEQERPVPPPAADSRALSGPKLQAALGEPLLATFRNREIRDLLSSLGHNRKLSLLLDRRIDPERKIQLKFRNEPLEDALRQICDLVQAELKLVGNVLYIGPAPSASKIRTLVALRSQELAAMSLAKERRRQLSAHGWIAWNDLDSPRDVVRQLADRHELSIEGAERIPHDLWAGAALAETSLVEALSLVLIQFDLTFAWKEKAEGIEIVPVPESPHFEKSYSVRGSPAETLRRWTEKIPDLDGSVQGAKIVVRGTAERHEEVDRLIDPRKGKRAPSTKPSAPVPLSNRRFSIQFRNGSARALMRELEDSGIDFQYREQSLDALGIDLDAPLKIAIDMEKATAQELFTAVFGPLGLKVQLDGTTVILTPK